MKGVETDLWAHGVDGLQRRFYYKSYLFDARIFTGAGEYSACTPS